MNSWERLKKKKKLGEAKKNNSKTKRTKDDIDAVIVYIDQAGNKKIVEKQLKL